MKIYVDIDETICYYAGDRNYENAIPYPERIKRINQLYNEGNEITYYTARGVTTGIDWRAITLAQLDKWGCRYHHLSMYEKPNYDLLICDKAINSEAFFKK
jgi:hypothetical protein